MTESSVLAPILISTFNSDPSSIYPATIMVVRTHPARARTTAPCPANSKSADAGGAAHESVLHAGGAGRVVVDGTGSMPETDFRSMLMEEARSRRMRELPVARVRRLVRLGLRVVRLGSRGREAGERASGAAGLEGIREADKGARGPSERHEDNEEGVDTDTRSAAESYGVALERNVDVFLRAANGDADNNGGDTDTQAHDVNRTLTQHWRIRMRLRKPLLKGGANSCCNARFPAIVGPRGATASEGMVQLAQIVRVPVRDAVRGGGGGASAMGATMGGTDAPTNAAGGSTGVRGVLSVLTERHGSEEGSASTRENGRSRVLIRWRHGMQAGEKLRPVAFPGSKVAMARTGHWWLCGLWLWSSGGPRE
ncbi:hypothetical protein C8J57DRAFT_1223734 [Mycena rebaudengoi]|nr:hypothetical protein C8J57DRAFT_1223734 [Mycena rebaudengoi]